MRVLRGEEISQLGEQGLLIRENFRAAYCEGVSYSLTLGSRFQSISKSTARDRNYQTIDGLLTLDPSEAVNVEINEKFNFVDRDGNPRYFGIILANARLLAGGVSHPATMMDPGFRGTTTLTLVNLRNFPSRSFRPGSDKIAKLIVVEVGADEFPRAWEETPAYLQSGPNEPPVLWGEFHMNAPWQPSQQANVNDLRSLGAVHGPPFDVIESHLLEQRKMLHAEDGSPLHLTTVVNKVREDAESVSRSIAFITHRVETLERAQGDLTAKVSAASSGLSELQNASLTEKTQLRQEKRETRRYWVNITVAIIAAVIGAVVTVLFSYFGIH
jgi:deoxycytidine triphosphate deaminase